MKKLPRFQQALCSQDQVFARSQLRNMFIFETSKLQVRPLAPADLPAFQTMQGSAAVMKYTTGIPLTPEESAHDMANIIACYDIEGNETWVWAVTTKTAGFVGTCALFKNDAQEFEIAYRLLDTCWGQGYGQEIADALIAFCLGNLGLHAIVAQTVKENSASVKILNRSRLSFMEEVENTEKHWIERHYRFVPSSGRGPGFPAISLPYLRCNPATTRRINCLVC